MKIVSMIIRCIFVAIFLLVAIGWCPSLTSLLAFIGAVLLLPIKPMDEALRKIKLTPLVRGIIAFVFLVIASVVAPDVAPATAERIANENAASQAQAEENDDDDDDEYEDPTIVGSWTYEEPQAVERIYTFNEDGTWYMSSEGGSDNSGTYEVIDDAYIKMKGEYGDLEFTIFDAHVIHDEDYQTLIPYDPNSSYDEDEE